MTSVSFISRTLVLLVLSALMSPANSYAQLKGHYVPGFTGLGNGSQAPPSVTIVLPMFFYTTDTLKDDEGETLGSHPRINSSFIGPGVVWVTNAKLFGGHLGGQILPVAFMKARIEGPSLDVPGSFNFSDIYVQPIQLGWETARADFVAGWGIFMPTGKWELGGDDNGGLGMWSNDFQAGTTVRLDNRRAWAASVLGTYEVHSKKKDADLKAGNILTLEGGLGHSSYAKVDGAPLPRITTVGLVYYAQFKVTGDTAGILTPLIEGKKDHVFGIGAEASVFLPKPKLLLGFRAVPEFGAVNRTQGWTLVATIGYQAKSLAKVP